MLIRIGDALLHNTVNDFLFILTQPRRPVIRLKDDFHPRRCGEIFDHRLQSLLQRQPLQIIRPKLFDGTPYIRNAAQR